MAKPSKYISVILIGLFLFSALFILFINVSTAEAAIVKCGRSQDDQSTTTVDETKPCEVCDILVLISDIINYGVTYVVPAVATLLFLFAGFLIILGGATPGQYQKGKDIFKNTCIGLLIIYGAWLVANTILQSLAEDENVSGSWFTIECVNPAYGGAGGGGTGGGGVSTGTLSAGDAWALLDAANIERNNPEPVTSFNGIRPKTVQEIIDLKNESKCEIVVTGGTEDTGAHTTGNTIYTHVNGYKFDMRPNDCLNSYIESKFTKLANRSDGALLYRAPDGALYAREKNIPGVVDHWDVVVY